MAAKLVAEEGALKGLVLSLEDSDHWVIGRDPDACQLLIEDPSASRKHLICRTTPEGILVENLSTTNPVQINDVEVKDPTLLKNGDAVKIGSGTFRFYAEAAARLFEGNVTKDEEGKETPEKQPAEKPEEKVAEKPEEKAEKPEEKQEAAPEPEAKSEVGVEVKEEIAHNDEQSQQDLSKDKAMEPQRSAEEPSAEAAQGRMTAAAPIAPQQAPTPLHEGTEEKHDTIYDEEPSGKASIAEINFGLLETGRWLLKVIGGPNNGAEFPMQTGSSYIIGTDPYACDVVFHDTSVSRQHARISVGPDDSLTIEDLKSRNKTVIDGEPLTGKTTLKPNSIITTGTTSFVVFDREGEMQTIVAPLFSLNTSTTSSKKDETPKPKSEEEIKLEQQQAALAHQQALESEAAFKAKTTADHHTTVAGLILMGILASLLVVAGIGTATLFRSEPIVKAEAIDFNAALDKAMAGVPTVRYSYNKATGQLLLIGHVLTLQDKSQLLYGLQGLKFIKSIDDSGIVIDEGVWRETNQLLEKNPEWRGINIISTTPGQFVLTGYMRTRAQADKLSEYLTNNFPYPDLLEKRVVIDEDITSAANAIFKTHGLKNIDLHLENGELTVGGSIPQGAGDELTKALKEVQEVRGVRTIFNQTKEQAPEEGITNISDHYEVTGTSSHHGAISVVINGRILNKGDIIDGMTISAIQANTIYLEKDGAKYRIDFNR